MAEDERQQVEPERSQPDASTLYAGLDGSGIPMRPAELLDHPGKGPDGSAPTREVKLCVIWTADGCDDEGHPIRDPGSATYTAAIESAATPDAAAQLSAFAQRVEREARRRSFFLAERQVVLGDGAPWIWNLAEELFPQALQIVDRFLAKEKLSTVAREICGPGSDLTLHWRRQRHDELDSGDLDAILRALEPHASSCDEARKALGYFDTNRHRMRYALFHAQGLCTSTGVVEAGCRHVVWSPAQALRHALDPPRSQRHPRPALRSAQPQSLRGLLATTSSGMSRPTTFLSYTPGCWPPAVLAISYSELA